MTRSGRSALVEHHPWLRRLSPNFPGRGLPSCNPLDSRLSQRAGPRLRFTPGRRVWRSRDVLTSPATWLDASLSVINTASGSRRSRTSRVP
jgi:hypothetical protein